MKKYLFALLILTATAWAQPSTNIGFVWDPNPATDNVTEYRVYELLDGTEVLRASTAETTVKVKDVVLDRDRTYVCRAVNAFAESPDSNAVVLDHQAILLEMAPKVPAGFKRATVTITIELQ